MAESTTGVAVFSSTTREQRERLGEQVTAWLSARPRTTVVSYRVTQSSDATHHCLSISLIWRADAPVGAIKTTITEPSSARSGARRLGRA